MDHSEASRLMASEKYLLDELSPTEMEAFEEHLFGCHECALDVRAGSVFLEHGKVELANPTPEGGRVTAEVRPSRGFSWWRPAFAIPALAILLIVVGYQNLVTFPAMKGALAENKAPRILPAASLVSSAVRGTTPSVIEVRRGEQFLLPVDIQPQSAFQSYVVELQNSAGGVQWSLPVSSESAKNTLTIQAPGMNTAGHYDVVVLGRNAQGQNSEVGRYPFDLQFTRAANPEP
ncbi:MAG: zf-HC2 domain-containing protein [Candidatus Sulfotelmatobacter sp.]